MAAGEVDAGPSPAVEAGLAGGHDLWAPDPVLDAATLVTNPVLATGGDPEAEATADAAAALNESGFGSALHTALGELRRITDEAVPAYAAASPTSSEGPWPPPEAASASERVGGGPADWFASLGDWWTARWRDLLPGMLVAGLVVVAFAVVLVSGSRHADTSHLDTRRSVSSDPSTTIPGLFTTESVPPGGVPPSGTGSPAGGGRSSPFVAPVTTKASSAGPAGSRRGSTKPPSTGTPTPTSPPPTSPPPTNPPPTSPPTTPPTTSPPTTSPPTTPPSTIDICAIRPTHC